MGLLLWGFSRGAHPLAPLHGQIHRVESSPHRHRPGRVVRSGGRVHGLALRQCGAPCSREAGPCKADIAGSDGAAHVLLKSLAWMV
eukprot:359651-Chlamydomonas_euryale.AAC.4